MFRSKRLDVDDGKSNNRPDRNCNQFELASVGWCRCKNDALESRNFINNRIISVI